MPIRISIKKINRGGGNARDGFVTCKIRLADLWDVWAETETEQWNVSFQTESGKTGQTIIWIPEPEGQDGTEYTPGLYTAIIAEGEPLVIKLADAESTTWLATSFQTIYIPYGWWYGESGPGYDAEYQEWIESFCDLANIPSSAEPVKMYATYDGVDYTADPSNLYSKPTFVVNLGVLDPDFSKFTKWHFDLADGSVANKFYFMALGDDDSGGGQGYPMTVFVWNGPEDTLAGKLSLAESYPLISTPYSVLLGAEGADTAWVHAT